MASHGFWSLGGDNAGANAGSQSPSTREWLFSVCSSVNSSIVSEQNRPAVCLRLRMQEFCPNLCFMCLKPELEPWSLVCLFPARAWCQAAAQKFSGGLGSKLCGMSVHGAEGSRLVTQNHVGYCHSHVWKVAGSLLSAALLNVGEAEKPADPAAKQPPPGEAGGTCGCNKSCNCTKAAVGFSDLYSTGTSTPRCLLTLRLTNGLQSRRLSRFYARQNSPQSVRKIE